MRIFIGLLLIASLAGAAENTLTDAEKAEGWKLLFDGKTTDGWRTYQKKEVLPAWKVVDGCLHLSKKGGGDLITKEKYKDFELKLQWKIEPNGNSGIFVRVSEDGKKAWFSSAEMQVMGSKGKAKTDKNRAGAVYDLFPAPKDSARPDGEWNDVRIVVKGTNYQYFFNKKKVAEFDASCDEWKKLVAGTKFKGKPKFTKNLEGHIGVQDHGNKVWFRNIKLREIK